MNTQEVWFEGLPEFPSHGCITDGAPGHACAVIDYASGQVVSPATHPVVHTILDVGQAVPEVMHAAKVLGFQVTYSLHGHPEAVLTL